MRRFSFQNQYQAGRMVQTRTPGRYDRLPMPSELYHAGPTDRREPFRFSAPAGVWFSDPDAQGVVYSGRYLPYFDHARLEYHRHLGLTAMWHGPREFVMRAMSVEYEAPAVFDDLLEVFVRMSRIGRTSIEF